MFTIYSAKHSLSREGMLRSVMEIDSASDIQEAEYLAQEYQLAFGEGYLIYFQRTEEEDED